MLVTDIKATETANFVHPQKADLTAICRAKGNCVSIFLGPHVAGSGSRPSADILREFLPRIDVALRAELLALSASPEMLAGHAESFCIYVSPENFHCFSISGVLEPGCHVEERFVVTPVLAHFDSQQDFLLLAVAEKHIRLLHCKGGKVETLPIPDGVPESVAEFSGRDYGTDRVEDHAFGVRFGTKDPREKEKGGEFRRRFMKAIDKGLQPLYRQFGLPLLLAGVDEETSAYAAISKYSNLIEERVQLSPDDGVTPAELCQVGARLVQRWTSPEKKQALAEYEKAGLLRRSTDPKEILAAAKSGKVHHLFLSDRGDLMGANNAVASEVLRHRGLVWLVEPEQMPDEGAIAAVYRYASGGGTGRRKLPSR